MSALFASCLEMSVVIKSCTGDLREGNDFMLYGLPLRGRNNSVGEAYYKKWSG